MNSDIIAEKLAIIADARGHGRTATETAALAAWGEQRFVNTRPVL